MATATRPAPPRNYWQLPTFVLGAVAAAAAYAQFPPPPTDPATIVGRDAAALRAELAKRPVDLAAVADLTRKVAADAEQSPAAADVARFLAGSGFVVLAEYGPVSESAADWAAAAKLLAAVTPEALPDPADPKRLAYRRAKAFAATGQGDFKTLREALSAGPVDPKEDNAERYRLLAEVYLKSGQPDDLKEAKVALTTYLGSPPRLPPAAISKLKLTLAQVYAAVGEPRNAKNWLDQLGAAAPPDVQAAAKVQLAQMAAADGEWSEVVRHYEAALAVPGVPDADRGAIRYQTGAGLMHLKKPDAARPYFEQALKDLGPVSTAAAVRLAEFTLRDPSARGHRGKAVDLLETAVTRVSTAAEFANPFVTAPEVQAAFEEAVQVCLNEPDYPTALRAVAAYAKVAAPGRDRERRAEVNAAWAAALQQDAKGAADAAAKLRDAAADYAALAGTYPTQAGKADLLRKAADCLKKAGDRETAIAMLDRVTKADGVPADAAAAAWLDKGDLLLLEGKSAEAETVLRRAMEAAGPTGAAARVKLGLVHIDRGRTLLRSGTADAADARKQLELGKALLAQVANKTADSAAEREAQQQALYELGKLLLQEANYADADARFRQLIQLNPSGPVVGSARLYLGSCLLLIARGDHQNGRPPADADRKLTEARDLFVALADSKDAFLRTQADVRLANTTLLLKRYEEMPALCERLAEKYRGRVEELIVLSMLYSGQRFSDRTADAARTLARMEDVYGKLRDADFPGGAEEYTREYWKKQWFDVLKPAGGVQ